MRYSNEEIVEVVLARLTHGDAFRYSTAVYVAQQEALFHQLEREIQDWPSFEKKYAQHLHRIQRRIPR